ncbi:MAG: hypothetical protein ACJAWT_001247 [Glaciecola sp.]
MITIKNGLGCQQAGAEKEQEIVVFDEAEQCDLIFQLGLVLDANSSKRGTSEIIKIPQIYSSVIFLLSVITNVKIYLQLQYP